MRPLDARLCLLGFLWVGVSGASADQTPEERALAIAGRASQAATNLRTAEHLELLQPIPDDRLLEIIEMPPYVALGIGWHKPEKWGVWSLGEHSVIHLRLPSGAQPAELFVNGRYLGGKEPTRLLVNDVLLSEAPLKDLSIALPKGVAAGPILKIELQHLNPLSPNDLDPSAGDPRKMKFGLMQLRVREHATPQYE